MVHRRPDGSGVGASRGAKQADPGSGRRAECITEAGGPRFLLNRGLLALFLGLAIPKTSPMSENQTEMPASGKRPAEEPADPPPHLPLPPATPALVLPNVLTKIFVRSAQILLSKGIMVIAELTAQEGIE